MVWTLILQVEWKSHSEEKNDKLCWLKNDSYHLHFQDEEIFRPPTTWLNDRIMDNTAHKLICKKLGADGDNKSVLNVQKPRGAPDHAVKNEHIQLLYDSSGHWRLSFCSNGRIQICDNLKTSLIQVNRKRVLRLYKNCAKESIVSFGPFAIAFAAEISDEKSPMEARFDVERMRAHLINCLNFSYHSQKFDLI